MTHALLSASSAHRWLACPPSMRLCLSYEDVPSTFAQEGTDAHALAQYMLEKALGLESEDPTDTLSYYSDEMKDHAENYAAFVMEELQHVKENCKDPLIFIEQKLDFSEFVICETPVLTMDSLIGRTQALRLILKMVLVALHLLRQLGIWHKEHISDGISFFKAKLHHLSTDWLGELEERHEWAGWP